ncbi:hypothetical protein BDZ45DRAFT_698714 [Acephala macrosclerotiorum]|nr:hypothetical protein BDZ45DRAFT_698714 [Acephala macrosclerotiorum]
MSSLEELSQDNGALGSQSAGSSHSSTSVLLLYDAMGQPPLAAATAALIRQTPLNPAIAEQELNRNPQIADWRYRLYLDLLVSVQHAPKAIWPAPQWDVAMMMHTHVLSPIKFAHDISSNPRYSCLAGKLDFPLLKLDHKLIHLHDRDTGANTRHENSTLPNTSLLSLDLVAGAKRQIGFARKITAQYPLDPVPENLLLDFQTRYAKFMNPIRTTGSAAIVPALDIDLFWHTHQLHSSSYFA